MNVLSAALHRLQRVVEGQPPTDQELDLVEGVLTARLMRIGEVADITGMSRWRAGHALKILEEQGRAEVEFGESVPVSVIEYCRQDWRYAATAVPMSYRAAGN